VVDLVPGDRGAVMALDFVPHATGRDRWVCPCQDAYGSAPELKPVRNYADESGRTPEGEVYNYICSKGDRWQRVVLNEGRSFWQYLGRREL